MSCTEQESYLIVHVCLRVVSMHVFCPGWSLCLCVDVVGGVLFGFAG